ncbi:MAG TPA: TIGR03435 family protein [Bryobacteraceae bacterium]|jgi:uncharacterized protein (TIGR03435 family)
MRTIVAPLAILVTALLAQEFEVATIKPSTPEFKGRYIRMQGAEFVARNHVLKTLLAAAYNLSPKAISGGPGWVETEHFDINARPQGMLHPDTDQQMTMLRKLIDDRFKIKFHREPRELPVYALTVAKGGPKLKPAAETPEGRQPLIITLFPAGSAKLPARDATMGDLASVMQRATLDRPVIDQTNLPGRYDFDLEWTPDEFQFNGQGPRETAESTHPDLFTAMQQQLGLRLEATRGPVQTLVIDQVERPTDN